MSDASSPEPADLKQAVFAALEEKASLPVGAMLLLGVLAGVYIGLGGLFATIALSGAAALPYGIGQLAAGFVFALGLALVIVAGAELFTGNTMMAGPVRAGGIAPGQAVRALAIVWCANLLGSLVLAGLVLGAGVHEGGDGAVGRAALDLGRTKTEKAFGTALASGVVANMLVCLGVWLAYAGQTVTQKIAGLLLPIAAFVAAGLEHSVANMYLLPYALMVQSVTDGAPAALSMGGIASNLVAATLGNIVGGASIALAYGAIYDTD